MLTTKHFSQKYFFRYHQITKRQSTTGERTRTPTRLQKDDISHHRRQHQRRQQHHKRRQRQKQYQPGRQLIQKAREEYQKSYQITPERKAAISPKIIFK